jgi:hypothetical protein
MAVDRPADDDPEESSSGLREQWHEQRRESVKGMSAEAGIVESRSRAEYYQALRAAADTASGSADRSPESAWDTADAFTRPPLDALRIPPDRALHILDGDATGGGHRYGAGVPGKTEFPANWTEDKIIDSILSVGRSPDSASLQRNGRWLVAGVRVQVALAVVINTDGRIWTAYPLPGCPGVRQNPRNQ